MVGLMALVESASCADGLLMNGDFAVEGGGPGVLTEGWGVSDVHEAVYTHVNDDGASESHSIVYSAAEAVPAGPVIQEFACAKNTEYVLTAAMKSDGTAMPLVRVISRRGDEALTVADLVSGGEQAWTVKTMRFNSGNSETLQVHVFGDAGIPAEGRATVGKSAIDDVQVYLASEAPDELAGDLALFDPPGPNIALDSPYTLTPAPNYGLCTDPDDKTQLTDGERTVGYFWAQPTTVGWSNAVPCVVTIDLGEVQPIAGVSYSTAAGVAGVAWPQSIGILVSEDNQEWTLVGDLIRLATRGGVPPVDKYSQHVFATGALQTRGRYVSLMIDSAPYCFVDEIEVYRGPEALLARAPEGRKLADPKQYFNESRVLSAILWRLNSDLSGVCDEIAASEMPQAEKDAVLAKADNLAAEIADLPEEVPGDFQTILPFSDLHARVYALRAPVLKAAGLPALTVWQRNRWDMLLPTDLPAPDEYERVPSLTVNMIRKEYRAEAFNLTNATDKPVAVRVNVTGLPGGDNPDYVSVREVLFTDTKDRYPIAAALPEAEAGDDGYKIRISAGCSRQVWLSFHPETIEAGQHTGAVEITGPAGVPSLRLPLTLKVYPLDLPDEVSIAVGGWDYTNGEGAYDATPANIPLLIHSLREHHVNTPWGNGSVRPSGGGYDAEGKLTAELDFARWDAWVQRWPDAKHYCVFLAVVGTFEGEPMGTDRFNRMVGDWAKAWTAHMRDQGIDPGKLAVLLVDEPHRDEQVQTILTWARAIEAAAPEIVIWEDPTYRDPREADEVMFDLMDVMCPNLPIFMSGTEEARQFYVDQQAAGRILWFYSCSGPMKMLDPYTYVRGQFWWAAKYDAKGSCYWAFADEARSGTSWNAYKLTRNQYSPLFIDATSVTDGKHMEAVREGAQDYEYFVMLRDRVRELEAAGAEGAAFDRAKQLLEDGPDRVIGDIGVGNLSWRADTDRGVMDQVRVELLEALVGLAGM